MSPATPNHERYRRGQNAHPDDPTRYCKSCGASSTNIVCHYRGCDFRPQGGTDYDDMED